MNRARPSIVAAALVAAGLAASSARAQGPPPSRHAPGVEVPPSTAATEPHYGPIRGFFHRHFPQAKKTPRSAHPDWTTGGDSKLSKPWLQPPGR